MDSKKVMKVIEPILTLSLGVAFGQAIYVHVLNPAIAGLVAKMKTQTVGNTTPPAEKVGG